MVAEGGEGENPLPFERGGKGGGGVGGYPGFVSPGGLRKIVICVWSALLRLQSMLRLLPSPPIR